MVDSAHYMRRILWTDGRTAVFCVNEIIRWFQKLKSCAFFRLDGGVIYMYLPLAFEVKSLKDHK